MNDSRKQSIREDMEKVVLGKDPNVLYEEALDLLQQNNYADAADLFEAVGQYADAPKFYVYAKAACAGENKEFTTACETFKLLGDFNDSPKMVLYYKAREIESHGIDSFLKAINAYTEIIDVRDSKDRILNCQRALYDNASELIKTQKFAEAATGFELLGDYSDSYFMKVYCKALAAESKASYLIASDLYKSISVFKDSSFRANQCKQKQYDMEQQEKQEQYDLAIEEYNSKHYCEALQLLGKIKGYRDVDSILAEPPLKVLKDLKEKKHLYLGLFPQIHPERQDIIENWSRLGSSDNYLLEQVRNGIVTVRPIEWNIIKKDKNKYTLISKYSLDAMAYDRNGTTCWENSSIRFWLNSFFYDKAFNSFEKGILFVRDSNGHEQDKVTLLTQKEARALMSNRIETLCSPTIYAVANGSSGRVINNRLICWWWLRTPGKYITLNGDIDESDVRDNRGTVRPVININIDMLVKSIVDKKIDIKKILLPDLA